MLTEVIEHLGKYYFKHSSSCKTCANVIYENIEMVFDATGKTITYDAFSQTYKEGQYILIYGTDLNDGIYKITAATSTQLTVEEDLTDETETAFIFPLRIPKPLILLVDEIETWITDYTAGAASEKIDDYSISFGQAIQINGFQAAFKGRLSTYNNMFDDLEDWKNCHGY